MPLFFLAAAVALIVDQITKIYVRANFPEGAGADLIPGWIHLEHVHNHGAAWGVLSGQKWLLIGFTLAVMVLVALSAREVVAQGRVAATGFGLILGGALGNLVDRVAFGYVTDFFDLDTPIEWLRTFPVFNVADSALTVGVVLMVLSLLLRRRSVQSTKPDSS